MLPLAFLLMLRNNTDGNKLVIFSSLTGATLMLHDMCSCYSHSVQSGVEEVGKGGRERTGRGGDRGEKEREERRGGEEEVE